MFWYPNEKDYDVKDNDGVTLRDFLESYDPNKYEHPAVTVDNLIFKKDGQEIRILLIKRGRHPSFGKLALPGGFVEMDETLDEAAARELFEETALTGIQLRQLGAYGDPGRDPRMRIISVAYTALISKDIEATAGDDAAEAGFFTVSCRKTLNNLETFYEFSFNNGQQSVFAKIKKTAGTRAITESGVASDHAIMILDAFERLGFIENM
jgi:8-oxo-dGTP diphosphatase